MCDEKLKTQISAQGSRQFLVARDKMLNNYDRAKIYSKSHIVQTSHGNVAEAGFRSWLSEFLPKRYGVTSGFVVSQGLKADVKTPHFDIIIYDILNSPILWMEDNPDKTDSGRSMAIPAEYVRAVLEVKSSFDTQTVRDSIEHLRELKILMSGNDEARERYKLYLPSNFACGLIFYELRKENQLKIESLSGVWKGIELRNFMGALILRGEGHIKPLSGIIRFVQSKEDNILRSNFDRVKRTLLSNGSIFTDSEKIDENTFIACILSWMQAGFAMFAFDLLATLQGTYRPGFVSSFHGLLVNE